MSSPGRRRRPPREPVTYAATCGHQVATWAEASGLCDDCIANIPKLPERFELRTFDGSPGPIFFANPPRRGRGRRR